MASFFQVNESSSFSAKYLFNSDAYPEFDGAWLEDRLSFLGELELAAKNIEQESKGLFDLDGVYIGERVQPKWMGEFKPRN
jgi:hypothetical protein